VYLARDERHRRAVALKVLHPALAHALGPERFLREIEVAANLSHPHILPLHDSGEAAGLLYYVMPYVEGESLRDRLTRETQLPVEDALRIAREVADALAYAHGQGVIHRDIKPENILLSGGHALVADFGIARALGQADDARLTETGMAVGTAAYMSPEQASGARHLDGRSDVYSLGCVLYEMLAGEPPYTGPTAQIIIAKRFTDPVPSVRRVRPSVPDCVDQAVTRALAPVPADRFGTMTEFTRALQPTVTTPTATLTVPGTPAVGRGSRRSAALDGRPLRRVRVLASTLGLGVLIGLGVLFAWRRAQVGDEGTKLLAVLPFENLGAAEDEYFADGVADDIRGRLSALPGVQVIARGSSRPYKKTTKTPQQIAQELGVQYLLTATVRWEKAPDGASQVHVTPELVDVRSGRAPRIKWQHPFEASLTDVFQVYADIGSRVAQELHLALGDKARRQLAERPTENLAAYDAYLRGKEVQPVVFSSSNAMLRQATAYYEQAVALDSSFTQAWVQLSIAHTFLFTNSTPTPASAARARRAAERARQLGATRGDTHLALGLYYQMVVRDHPRAIEEFKQGRRIAPMDTDLLNAAGTFEQSLGQWDSALTHFQRAEVLDPRSIDSPRNVMQVLLHLRRYPEARAAADRALALAPTNLDVIEFKAMLALAQGDLAGARALVTAAPKEVDRADLVAYFATYWDLYWILDDAQQQLLLHLPPSAFDDDRSTWGIVLAQTYSFRGDQDRARVYADSARIAAEEQLRAEPKNPDRHILRGLALAYLGRKSEAIREGQLGVSLYPIAEDALNGPYRQHQLVRIYLILGEPERALDQLEPLLTVPYYLSPAWLRIDPNFATLRSNPRFLRLVEGKA
nr:protein kinase [Gemmatimonadales bacterium]